MKKNIDLDSTPQNGSSAHSRWRWLLITVWALVILIGLLNLPQHDQPVRNASSTAAMKAANSSVSSEVERFEDTRLVPRRFSSSPAFTAEEIVASKVSQFGRSRREIVRAIAKRTQKEIPPEVERFFEAIESGNWEEIDAQWKGMSMRSGQYDGSTHSPELDPFWPSVLDAYGVAEQAHLWPAQKLLDYGNAILDTLRPGMVYVGGTDPGRWIPELLNETSGGEPHIIVTQNAFADSRYLEFMNELYGDRMATLTNDDSQRAFQEYVADARKRLEHDQQFPNEPKQIRPGEDVRLVEGKVQVAGQTAVMAINEKMFQMLLDKNPDFSFAMEQSFPFKSTYDNATPAGPIMEVRVQDEQNALTQERAAQSVDYWRATTEKLLSDSQAADSRDVRLTYSKMASSQAELLLNRNYTAEAEQTYRLATEIGPASPEAVFGYVNLLAGQHRIDEAIPVAEAAIQANPEKQGFRDLLNQLKVLKKDSAALGR
jgi:tetratricopeptide (TPR) repeat protein